MSEVSINTTDLNVLRVAVKIFSAVEKTGKLSAEEGKYTVYKYTDSNQSLENIGCCEYYFQAISLLDNGIIIHDVYNGGCEYDLIINGNAFDIDINLH